MTKFANVCLASAAVLLLATGCWTKRSSDIVRVDPPVEATQIAWDGNDQNAGLIQSLPEGGFHVTPGFRTRLIALADKYGSRVTPPASGTSVLRFLTSREDGTFVITAEGMVLMLDLVDLNREGFTPASRPRPHLEDITSLRQHLS